MAAPKRVSRTRGGGAGELSEVIQGLRKQYGDAVVTRADSVMQVPRISTGIFTLDFALLGGFPSGRASMIVGEKHAGKTMLADRLIAGAQQLYPDGQPILMDIEGTHDSTWAAKQGVDVSNLLVVQPETGEHAVDMADALAHTKDVSLIVVDSVAALTPFKEIEDSAEDAHVGVQARLVGRMIRKLTLAMITERHRGHDITILFLNQFRCLDEETLVWSRRGLLPIKEVVVGDEVESPTGMVTVRAAVATGEKEGVEVVARTMPPLRMSNEHRHFVVGEDGRPLEVFGADIEVGDWLVSPTAAPTITGEAAPMHHDIAAFLGAYFADGSVIRAQGRQDARVSFTEVDDTRRGVVGVLLLRMFGFAGSYSHTYCTVGKPAVDLVDAYGVGRKGVHKRVPEAIRCGSDETVRVFLRHASFDTHGFTRNKFLWTFETEEQAYEVAALLRRLGIRADSTVGPAGGRSYLSLSGDDAVAFRDTVGFAESTKQALAQVFTPTQDGARGRYDVVPRTIFYRVFGVVCDNEYALPVPKSYLPEFSALQASWRAGLNASRIRLLAFATAMERMDSGYAEWVNLLSTYRFAQVDSVAPILAPMVDIEVDGGMFVANGLLTHNSKIGGFSPYGEARSIPGGKSLEFCTSVQLVIKNKENHGKGAHGVDVVVENEHAFTVTKNKLNGGARTGEFRIRRAYDETTGLNEGEVDDAVTMLAFAKKFDLYTGGGSRWSLNVWDKTYTFRSAAQAAEALYADPELKYALRNNLIYEQARVLNMPADFLEGFMP